VTLRTLSSYAREVRPSLPAGVHSNRLEYRIGHFENLWREALREHRTLRLAG